MAKFNFDDSDGVWRTIGGRRVFIRNGQSISDAMKKSGKFKSAKKKNEYTKEELKEKYGTDDTDIINAGKEQEERVSIKESDEKNPIEKMANDRIKEKENTLANDKAMLEAMKRKEIDDVNGWKKEDFENRIGKNEEYLKNAKSEQKEAGERLNEIKEKSDNQISNTKYTADEDDILNRFSEDYGYDKGDNLKNLKGQIDYMRNPNESIHRTAERLVEGGDFLIYNGDIKDWLSERNIKYNDDNFFDVYKKEMADKIESLYNQKQNNKVEVSGLKEKTNAKIKIDEPNKKNMSVDAYAGYKEKFNNTWGEDGSKDKVVSAKMYSNDEFMEHLTDSNWHSERKALEQANLTNKELEYIKNRTNVSAWGVENLTGKEQVEKLIQEAKNQNNSISNSLRRKAYQKYLKEHPASKLTFEDFKDMNKLK